MGMLERYKKRGGFLQLLVLLETTEAAKKEKFLKMILDEDPAWDEALRQRMISFDRVMSWEASVLMEFLPQVPVMSIAYAISQLSSEKKTPFIKALTFGSQKKVEEILNDNKPKPGEVISAQMKVISELRNQVAVGKINLEKIDPLLAIAEDIEEMLTATAAPVKKTITVEVDCSKDPGAKATTAASIGATHVSPKSASAQAQAQNSGQPANYGAVAEELNTLKRKMAILTQENVRLMKEIEDYKGKLTAIKAAFQKTG